MTLAVVLAVVAAAGVMAGYLVGRNARALNALAYGGGVAASIAGLVVGERLAGFLNPFEDSSFARALAGGLLFAGWVLGVQLGSHLRRRGASLAKPDAQYSEVRAARTAWSALAAGYSVFWWIAMSLFVGIAWLVAAQGWVKALSVIFFAFGAWAVFSTIRNRG